MAEWLLHHSIWTQIATNDQLVSYATQRFDFKNDASIETNVIWYQLRWMTLTSWHGLVIWLEKYFNMKGKSVEMITNLPC